MTRLHAACRGPHRRPGQAVAKKKRHSRAEIATKLAQANDLSTQGKLQSEIARTLGVSVMTLHRWRKAPPGPQTAFVAAGQPDRTQARACSARSRQCFGSSMGTLAMSLPPRRTQRPSRPAVRKTPAGPPAGVSFYAASDVTKITPSAARYYWWQPLTRDLRAPLFL
jgi:transposase-like protein